MLITIDIITVFFDIFQLIIWQAILKAKSSSLIGYSSVGILQYGPLPSKRSVWIFSSRSLSSREIQTAKTQKHKIKCKKPRPENKLLSF